MGRDNAVEREPARRMNWKTFLGLGAAAAAVAVAIGFFYPFRNRREELRLPGVVETQEVRLGSKIGGRVAEVYVAEGDLVEAEQKLVRFEVPELEAQREQLAAQLKATEWELTKLRKGPRAEEIRQARSNLESAEADLKFAREDFIRIEKLFRQGGATRAEYDLARAARDRAQGRSDEAQAGLALLEAGTRPEEIAMAEARVAEIRGKLNEIEANLKEAVVRAPGPAVVEVLSVRKGDIVPANQPIVRVLSAEDIWVKVYVPETKLGKVRVGGAVEVTVDAYPGRRFAGTVTQIASESEFTPRNIQSVEERRHQVFGVKVRVAQPRDPKERVFKSGMAAEVFLPLEE